MMEYAEALKKVTATKPKENFMAIQTAYDRKLILPYKDGVAFMAALNNAEELKDGYGDPQRISEFDRKSITACVMSHEEYIRYKIAALLGVKPEEIKASQLT